MVTPNILKLKSTLTDTSPHFFKNTPPFYHQPLPLYGKNLKSPFLGELRKLKPPSLQKRGRSGVQLSYRPSQTAIPPAGST